VMYFDEFDWGHAVERRVRPVLVIVDAPSLDRFPGVVLTPVEK